MKVAIVGSREFPDWGLVTDYVKSLPADTIVVSGRCRGPDKIAEQQAGFSGLKTLIFPADWEKHGKAAGFIRNEDIVKNCDRLVAFWDGASRGTKHSITLALQLGKPVEIFNRAGEKVDPNHI